MKIALIGYGKMGKAIEAIAIERGHTIVAKANSSTPLNTLNLSEVDVAIEFTRPELVLDHIQTCLEHQTPVVVGTTAWNHALEQVTQQVKANNGALLHASNFSVGVNIFFEINKQLARIMNRQPEYSVAIEEIHHLQKLDAPSGTAITIANDLMHEHAGFQKWVLGEETMPEAQPGELPIVSFRKPDVPGTHIVSYRSEIDTIQFSHEAHSRKGFALGAVLAGEFLAGKNGIYTMSDVLKQ